MSTPKYTNVNLFLSRLRELRGSRSKAAFARFLGLKPPVYQNYENGRVPSPDNLSLIAQKCGTTVDWLLGRQDGKPGQSNLTMVRECPARYGSPGEAGETSDYIALVKGEAGSSYRRLINTRLVELQESTAECREEIIKDLEKWFTLYKVWCEKQATKGEKIHEDDGVDTGHGRDIR